MIINLCSKQVRFFLLALTILLLYGCSAQPAVQQTPQEVVSLQQPAVESNTLTTKTYVNTKHAFTFSYPKVFERRKDYQDGDGMYFMNDDASLLIWGTPIEQKQTNQSLVKEMNSKSDHDDSTYDSYTIRTYDKNDLRYCYGSKHKNNVLIQVQFTYPVAKEDEYDHVVQTLINEIADSE